MWSAQPKYPSGVKPSKFLPDQRKDTTSSQFFFASMQALWWRHVPPSPWCGRTWRTLVLRAKPVNPSAHGFEAQTGKPTTSDVDACSASAKFWRLQVFHKTYIIPLNLGIKSIMHVCKNRKNKSSSPFSIDLVNNLLRSKTKIYRSSPNDHNLVLLLK